MTNSSPSRSTPPGDGRRSVLQRLVHPNEGDPDIFSSERSFAPQIGINQGPVDRPRGYYIDFTRKAASPAWPPEWLPATEDQLHVATVQWALGAWERYLHGDGEQWRQAALDGAEHLLEAQIKDGAYRGAWLHWFPMPHTYDIQPPWSSAIAQGEAASLMTRLYLETEDERFADAARLALEPMRSLKRDGGLLADVDGSPFYEEYPTRPDSLVLNGTIFALWGFHDVAAALDDSDARVWYERGIDGLAKMIDRYDTGYWSLYDLYPHPLKNVASPAYHLLHINQLSVLERLTPRPEFASIRKRFEAYRVSRASRTRAVLGKVAFRIVTPRNGALAHRLPWNRRVRGQSGDQDLIVLCYHAVSDDWDSSLAVSRAQLHEQVSHLLEAGYKPATFTDGVMGPRPERTFVVTFDDAFASVAEQGKPVLDRLGVPGTVFVPTGFTGSDEPMTWPGISEWRGGPHEDELRPLSWDTLRDLHYLGWEIGSHSRTHARLTEITPHEQLVELRQSRQECERRIGRPCTSLAFPYGAYDQGVIRTAAEAGYATAASLPPPFSPQSVLAWPRIGIYRVDTQRRFRLKISRFVRWLRRSRLGPMLAVLLGRVSGRTEGAS